jgi:hypothetical protein
MMDTGTTERIRAALVSHSAEDKCGARGFGFR